MSNQEQNSPDFSKMNEKELGDHLKKIVEEKMKGYVRPITTWLGKFSIPYGDVVGEVEPNRFLLETKEVSNEDYNKFFFSLQKQEREFWGPCISNNKKSPDPEMVKVAETLNKIFFGDSSWNINVGFLERGFDGKFKLAKREYYSFQNKTEHDQKNKELEEQYKEHCHPMADIFEDRCVKLISESKNEWTDKKWEDYISRYFPVKEM